MSSVRRLLTVLAVVVAALVLVPATAASAQDGAPCPVEDGVVPAAGANGPSTTGQCVPSRGIRLLDSALWVWTLGALAVVVVALVRSSRVSDDDR